MTLRRISLSGIYQDWFWNSGEEDLCNFKRLKLLKQIKRPLEIGMRGRLNGGNCMLPIVAWILKNSPMEKISPTFVSALLPPLLTLFIFEMKKVSPIFSSPCRRYQVRISVGFIPPSRLTRKSDSKFYFGLPNSNLQVMAGPLPPKQSSHTWRRSRHVTKCHFWQNIPKNEKRHVKQTPWHLTDQKKNVIFLWQQFWFFDLQTFSKSNFVVYIYERKVDEKT